MIEQGDWCQPIHPLSTGERVAEFYGYERLDDPYDARDGTARTSTGIAKSGTSELFLFDNNGQICLVVIHDAYEAGAGTDPTAWMSFNRMPAGGRWMLQDDPEDFEHRWSDPPHSIRWFWNRGETDGGAFCGGLDGEFEIAVQMLSMGTLDTWRFLTGDATHPDYVTLDPSEPVLIRTGTCDATREDDDREVDPTQPAEPTFPIVKTKPAERIDCSSATLVGKMVDLGSFSNVRGYFKWRKAGTGQWHATDPQEITGPGAFDAEVSGLYDRKSYEYRAVAQLVETGQVVKGGILTFGTPKCDGGTHPPDDPNDPKDPEDPSDPDEPPLKPENVIFCGCGRVCASGSGTGKVILERPGKGGTVTGVKAFDFCTTPGKVGAPGGKILAVSATTEHGDEIVVLNPNNCAQRGITDHGLSGEPGRSGGPCNAPP